MNFEKFSNVKPTQEWFQKIRAACGDSTDPQLGNSQ